MTNNIIKLPKSKTTIIYLYGEIPNSTEVFNMIEIFKVFKLSKKGDIIILEILNAGGSNYVATSIISHILKSPAKVICNLQVAQSAGACIALACDVINVLFFAEMMIHQTSWKHDGNITNGKDQFDFAINQYGRMDSVIYKTFLNEKEIIEQQNGKEFWFDELEIKKRLKNHIPLRKRIKNFT